MSTQRARGGRGRLREGVGGPLRNNQCHRVMGRNWAGAGSRVSAGRGCQGRYRKRGKDQGVIVVWYARGRSGVGQGEWPAGQSEGDVRRTLGHDIRGQGCLEHQ
jgi:hypothetical protein